MGPAEDEGEQERDPLRAAREVNLETRVAMGLVGATKSIVIHRDEYTYTGWESTLTNVSIGDVGKNKYLHAPGVELKAFSIRSRFPLRAVLGRPISVYQTSYDPDNF